MSKESPLISLCLIAGNEEMHVRRCLKTFAPMADEIIVVRAIGNLKPDATLDIAHAEFGAITAEYRNAPENADWPHVDNFANARNMAFDLATGQFQVWVDFDDIAEADHVLGFRDAAENANLSGWDVIHLPYSIPYSGASPRRERIIRRGCGKWVGAVHECIHDAKEGNRHVVGDDIVVVHAPLVNKTRNGMSNSRNIRILDAVKDKSIGELYYHHQELIGLGRNTEAIAAGKLALGHEALGPHERYEIFTNLALISQTNEQRRTFLLHAFGTDPTRREALALMMTNELNGATPNARASLAYAQMMRALPKPDNAPSLASLRNHLYTPSGEASFYSMALRANGKMAEADALQLEAFRRAGGKISLLHATRGRGQQALTQRKFWIDSAINPELVEHIFACDDDDRQGNGHIALFNHTVVPVGGGCCAAWNAAATVSSGEVLIAIADDVIPPIGWDRAVLEAIGDTTKPAVLATSDGHRKDTLLTLAILTRARLVQQGGKVWHPRFKSVYCDNYFTHQAYKDGVVIEARQIVFEHSHPVFTGAPIDKTYAESNAVQRYIDGRAAYMELTGETLPELVFTEPTPTPTP